MTGLWLTESNPIFQDWKRSPNSRIWLSGIPGAGKTVLCGAVIDDVLQTSSTSIAVAFYFCDYKSEISQEPTNILASLAVQLALQLDEAFNLLQEYYHRLHPDKQLSKQPAHDELLPLIVKMASLYDKAFLIVDGLDECSARTNLAAASLRQLSEQSQTISLAIFSRDEVEIREELGNTFAHVEIAAHTEDIDLDVRSEMNNRSQLRSLGLRNAALDEEICHALVDGAQGMQVFLHFCPFPPRRARWERS
jgi:hypothetical protein